MIHVKLFFVGHGYLQHAAGSGREGVICNIKYIRIIIPEKVPLKGTVAFAHGASLKSKNGRGTVAPNVPISLEYDDLRNDKPDNGGSDSKELEIWGAESDDLSNMEGCPELSVSSCTGKITAIGYCELLFVS